MWSLRPGSWQHLAQERSRREGVCGLSQHCSGRLTEVFFFFCFLGSHPQHMEVPRLG